MTATKPYPVWQRPTGVSPFVGRKRGEIEVDRAVEDDVAMNDIVTIVQEVTKLAGDEVMRLREMGDKDLAAKEFRVVEARIQKALDKAVDKRGIERVLIWIEGNLENIVEETRLGSVTLDNDDMILIGLLTMVGTAAAKVSKTKTSQNLDDVVDELGVVGKGMF